jgi:hypothetical protein
MEQACAAVSAEMERFFKEYERFANSADPGGITSLFSAEFMFGDPAGVRVVPTEGMAMAVAKRKRLFEGLGSRETRMVSLKTMELNDQYVLAEAEWAGVCAGGCEGDPVEVVVCGAEGRGGAEDCVLPGG